MEQQIKNRILSLLALLSAEQKEKEILEIDETNDEKLVAFLKKDRILTVEYEIEYDNFKPYISEKSGTVNLWYKNINGNWTINLYYINRIINVQ